MTNDPSRTYVGVMAAHEVPGEEGPTVAPLGEGLEGAEGWFLIAPHALPPEWRDRAVPVYLVGLGADEVRPFLAPQGESHALDPEEQAVARLAARGASPREIAATLHLSRRSVFRRLARLRHLHGVETNAELATKLAKQGI